MTLNSIWWWGSCFSDQERMEYPIITLTPKFEVVVTFYGIFLVLNPLKKHLYSTEIFDI